MNEEITNIESLENDLDTMNDTIATHSIQLGKFYVYLSMYIKHLHTVWVYECEQCKILKLLVTIPIFLKLALLLYN